MIVCWRDDIVKYTDTEKKNQTDSPSSKIFGKVRDTNENNSNDSKVKLLLWFFSKYKTSLSYVIISTL